ncbi:S8 family serine peptidase [Dokdonella sp.]|uniref:S8 family serine peptidase n=1 Tax=Dokdonella sp. TaxID=2291710 RepID=UPI0031C6E710|nr:S8 family serine peptidase [Dokdonella sp.]
MSPDSRWLVPLALGLACSAAGAAQIAPGLGEQVAGEGTLDVLLVLPDQARPSIGMPPPGDYKARRRQLVDALRRRAADQQADVLAWLTARGVEHRAYWIANLVWARVSAPELAALAAREDIARIEANPRIAAQLPQPLAGPLSAPIAAGIEWGVARISAPAVWAEGHTGQGVVIGGADTGYQWNHPALKRAYRGWDGVTAVHDYHWHDAIHDAVGNPCGNDAPAPCDDQAHGTHTAGTFAGDDHAGHQIGVAPGARWIGCRNMADGWGTPARYIECMQWMLAPTDLQGANPQPDLAPDIISNSWGCIPSEGCQVGNEIHAAVDNVVAGGILFVVAAGNDGSACSSIFNPPATYDASFVIGATQSDDELAGFSGRGPVSGSIRMRPDVVAPGVGVLSSVPGGGYGTMSGTSMATPHVAGAAALLMSVNPALKGDPQAVAALLRATAVRTGIGDPWNSGCGGLGMGDWPNYQAGYGRIDVYAAALAAAPDQLIFSDGFDGPGPEGD